MNPNGDVGCDEPIAGAQDMSAVGGEASIFEPVVPTVIPSHILIPHRLGFSTVRLNKLQKSSRMEAETLALYKQLKYNNVNTFYRFITFILCLLVPSLFCHSFGIGTTEWFVMQYRSHHRSLGMFFACREGLSGICIELTGSNYARVLRDRLTHEIVCEVTEPFAQRYIGIMWSLGFVQFVLSFLALILTLRMACRPTRSRSSLLVLCFLAATLPCGIANCVLFYVYTGCDLEECAALHYTAPDCTVHYSWGYSLYIAAICLDFCACVTALCLCSYPYSLYNNAARLLAQQRSENRGERSVSKGGCESQECHDARTENSTLVAQPPANFRLEPDYTRVNTATDHTTANNSPTATTITNNNNNNNNNSTTNAKNNNATTNNNNNANDTNSASRRNSPFSRLLRMVRGAMDGPSYLTAVELGVQIDGASDWLYDDKSDLFYSPSLNMFWDPLTYDYYSCSLQSWQVTVEGFPGLRSAVSPDMTRIRRRDKASVREGDRGTCTNKSMD